MKTYPSCYVIQMKQLKLVSNYHIAIFKIDFLPDKAIDLLDEAGSKMNLSFEAIHLR